MSIKHHLPGFIAALLIALLSVFLSTLNASFDPLVISIIIGMFLGNVFVRHAVLQEGIESAVKLLLPAGIALYGTQLSVGRLAGSQVSYVLLVFSGLFGLTMLIARIFNVGQKLSLLLACGLSVCGATAIAVISPLIGAKREETSISVVSVMMLGLTGMIFYPVAGEILRLSTGEFSFLAGATLPMLGQVKVAASGLGPDALDLALKIKLIRISLLFVLVAAAFFLPAGDRKKTGIPWFLLLFILFAATANMTDLFDGLGGLLSILSSFCLSTGLAAIGYSVDFDSIIEQGITPLGVIVFSWGLVLLLMFLARSVV